MSDEEVDSSEEIDMETSTVSVVADWPTQIGNGGSLLIPQPLPNSSRTSSISSADYQMTDHGGTSFHYTTK